MVLSKEAIPGQSFSEYLANDTQVLELDITPNRADCFSHYGVARDYAAKKNIKLISCSRPPVVELVVPCPAKKKRIQTDQSSVRSKRN